MNWFSVVIGKLVIGLLKLFGRSGSALPGLIIERTNPKFLRTILARLPDGVVVISGTNGKTTTTKLVSAALTSHGKRVLTNETGSNFVRGIISLIVRRATWSGRLAYDMAVIELDEAYAVKFVQQHKPRAVVVLNVMRDQMDRFGEIDKTAELLGRVAAEARELVVLNGDDPRVRRLADKTEAKVVFFAVAPTLHHLFPQDDELHGGKLQAESDLTQSTARLESVEASHAVINLDGEKHTVRLAVGGNHNALNATAAALTVHELGFSEDELTMQALAATEPAFGRGESLNYKERHISLQLVKNPSGFRHLLHGLESIKPSAIIIAINDNYADGRDVSWLWDVTFENLVGDRLPIITSGSRAADMAVRLKYDGVDVAQTEPGLSKALQFAIAQTEPDSNILIYCTYTAMLELRQTMGKKLGVTQ